MDGLRARFVVVVSASKYGTAVRDFTTETPVMRNDPPADCPLTLNPMPAVPDVVYVQVNFFQTPCTKEKAGEAWTPARAKFWVPPVGRVS
jgi:hypothetical protein